MEWPQRSSVCFRFSHVLFLICTVKTRINGTLNIAKITKSMKMVSAAKLRGDQARLTAVNPFAVLYDNCIVYDLL